MRLTALTVGSRGDAKPYLALAGAAAGWPPGDPCHPPPVRARRPPPGGSGSRRPRATLDRCWRPSKGTPGWRPAAIRCVAHGGCWRWPAPWRPGRWPTRPPPARTPRPSSTPVGVWRRPDRRAQPRPGGAGLAAAAQPHPGVPGPGRARLAVWVAPITLLSHLVAVQFGWQPFRGLINQWRRHTLGLPPAPLLGPDRAPRRRRAPVLYGYSRWVVPKPPDWGQHLHVTG